MPRVETVHATRFGGRYLTTTIEAARGRLESLLPEHDATRGLLVRVRGKSLTLIREETNADGTLEADPTGAIDAPGRQPVWSQRLPAQPASGSERRSPERSRTTSLRSWPTCSTSWRSGRRLNDPVPIDQQRKNFRRRLLAPLVCVHPRLALEHRFVLLAWGSVHPRLALEHRFVLLAWGTTAASSSSAPSIQSGANAPKGGHRPPIGSGTRAGSISTWADTGRTVRSSYSWRDSLPRPPGAPCPRFAEGLTPPATSGEEMRRDMAHILSPKTWEVAQKAIATFACARSQGPATSVRSALPARRSMRRSGYDRGRSKGGAARPSSNLPAEHGPREALASRESPAQVPRHQPARHPHAHVRPAERLSAYPRWPCSSSHARSLRKSACV